MLGRQTFRRIRLEIHDREASLRTERLFQAIEIAGAIVDVVVGVDDHDHVDRLRNIRAFLIRNYRKNVAQVFGTLAFAQVAQHVGLDVDRETLPSGTRLAMRTLK